MKKGILNEFLFIIFFILILVPMLFYIYNTLIKTTELRAQKENIAIGRLRSTASYTNTLSSPEGLSTGEFGVLNQTLLENKDNSILWNSYLPSFWRYIEVKNLQSGEKYVFGTDYRNLLKNYSLGYQSQYFETFKVAIRDGSEVDPGVANLSFAFNPNIVLYLNKLAHIVDKTEGKRVVTLPGPQKSAKLKIHEREICLEIDGKEACKKTDVGVKLKLNRIDNIGDGLIVDYRLDYLEGSDRVRIVATKRKSPLIAFTR